MRAHLGEKMEPSGGPGATALFSRASKKAVRRACNYASEGSRFKNRDGKYYVVVAVRRI
jgi:hypothetical protein